MIASGHPNAFDYTPRQIAGFLYFVMERKKREAAQHLSIGALASRGDPKEVKKTLKDWSAA